MRARPLQSFRLGAAQEGVGGGERQGREAQEWGPSQDLGCWAAAPSGLMNGALQQGWKVQVIRDSPAKRCSGVPVPARLQGKPGNKPRKVTVFITL